MKNFDVSSYSTNDLKDILAVIQQEIKEREETCLQQAWKKVVDAMRDYMIVADSDITIYVDTDNDNDFYIGCMNVESVTRTRGEIDFNR